VKFGYIKVLVAELRIDIDEMSQEEKKKFYTMIKNFIHHE